MRRPIGALLIALLILLLAGFLSTLSSGYVSDSPTYVDQARQLDKGLGPQHSFAYWDPVYDRLSLPTDTSLWPTGYPRLLHLFELLGLPAEWAGRLSSVLATGATAALLYLIAALVLSPARALLATIGATVSVAFLVRSSAIATEPLYILLSVLVWYALSRYLLADRRSQLYWLLVASVAAALSFSLRYVGLSNVACVVAFVAIANSLQAQAVRLPNGVHLLTAVAITASVVAPIMIGNYALMGTIGQPWPGADIFWTYLPTSISSAISMHAGRADLLAQWGLGWIRWIILAVTAMLVAIAMAQAASKLRWRSLIQVSPSTAIYGPGLAVVGGYFSILIVACIANGMNVETRYAEPLIYWAMFLLLVWVLDTDQRFARSALVLAAVLIALQGLVLANWTIASNHSHYSDATHDAATIAWVRSEIPVSEIVLVSSGGEVSRWVPHNLLRIPRLPHSAKPLNWRSVDRLADSVGAKYLVHRRYRGPSKFDQEQFQFYQSLNAPERHPARAPMQLDELFVVYRVGTAR